MGLTQWRDFRGRVSYRGMKCLVALCMLCVTLPLLHSQPADSLESGVLRFTFYEPLGDHRTSYHTRWLQPGGTFVSIWEDSDRSGRIYYVAPPLTGTVTYTTLSASMRRIVFSDYRFPMILQFTDATSGTIRGEESPYSAAFYGSFTFRPAQTTGVVNVSTRTTLSNASQSVAGFILSPGGGRLVLIRGSGPSLSTYGVTRPAGDLKVSAYSGTQPVTLLTRTDWNTSTNSVDAFGRLFAMTGAFPLDATSNDVCMIADLPPGAYTLTAQAAQPGEALVEVYFLP